MQILLTILCVIAAVAALFALILSLWVKLRIVYDAERGLRVWAQLLFYKYHLLPVREPKLKLRDYKIKRFRKLERKRRLKEEKEKIKAIKKRAVEPEPAEISRELPLGEKISILTRVIKRILRRFARYLRVDVSKLYIKVASDDAAKTAYLYSAAAQSAAYLTEMLRGATNFDVEKGAQFTVFPDFTSEQSELAADFTFRIRVFNILKLAMAALAGYSRVKKAGI